MAWQHQKSCGRPQRLRGKDSPSWNCGDSAFYCNANPYSDDARAPAYRKDDTDITHPYRQKEVVEELNNLLRDERKITTYDVQCVRKVHKVNISRPDFCNEPIAGGTCPSALELQIFVPGNICLPSNPGKCTEARDWLTECRDAHERHEQRLETIEIGVVALSLFFGLRTLPDGQEQTTSLGHLDTSTAATASAMTAVSKSLQSLADAQAASLKILQTEEADRLAQLAKRPELVL